MPKHFKEARLKNKIKLIDAAQLLGVSQPALSGWEGERTEPGIDMIKKMADLYKVSVEYLLCYDSYEMLSHKDRIPKEAIPLFYGKPVWIPGKGWALVNSVDDTVLYVDGSKEAIGDNPELYFAPPVYAEPETRIDDALTYDELFKQKIVYVEPISTDRKLREMLRGKYRVFNGFVENDHGNRFTFDSYQTAWLAFRA